MNTVTNTNYQTTFGMKQNLKTADIIQRKAKNTYAHISPYLFEQQENVMQNQKLKEFVLELKRKLFDFRYIMQTSPNPQKLLIENLKRGNKLGNSGEEVDLATIIGKINGQKNIYSASVNGLDHAVSIITNKIVKNGQKQIMKNKDAIIIDPQLGITDYAGNYFAKLKEIMGKPYQNATKNEAGLAVIPRNNHRLNKAQIADLKTNYPELLIADYKHVKV